MPNNVKVKVTTRPGWLWGEWACRLPRRERPLERLDCSAGSSHGRDSPSAQKDSFLTVGPKDCSGESLPRLLSLLSRRGRGGGGAGWVGQDCLSSLGFHILTVPSRPPYSAPRPLLHKPTPSNVYQSSAPRLQLLLATLFLVKEKLESSVGGPRVGRVLQRVEREVSFGFCFQEDVEALGGFSLWMTGVCGGCSLTLRSSSLLQLVGCRLNPALGEGEEGEFRMCDSVHRC